MNKILEPVFLNEKMVLNTAAHLFQGYSLREEKTQSKEKSVQVEASLGVNLLSKLFSPISAKGELTGGNASLIKSERLYTLGGLHMSVLEELKRGSKDLLTLNLTNKEDKIRSSSFVSANVILKLSCKNMIK